MPRLKFKFERISPDAVLPVYQHQGDSGADLCSIMNLAIGPLERAAVSTGLRVEVPKGYELQIRSRSGLALNDGIFVLNSPGTIDSGYRGEIKVILMNLSKKPFKIKKGQRIAQIVLAKVGFADFYEVKTLSKSKRGQGGFGSTGT